VLLRLIEKEKKRGCLAYPVKLGVVQSTTRSWSSSILKKEQFSHPDSLNCTIIIIFLPTNNRPKNLKCNNREKEEEGEEGEKCGNKEENLIISFDKAATKTGSELMSKARRNLRGCTSHSLPSSASLMCCVCGQEDGGKKTAAARARKKTRHVVDLELKDTSSFFQWMESVPPAQWLIWACLACNPNGLDLQYCFQHGATCQPTDHSRIRW
jgi:hypothetical protein